MRMRGDADIQPGAKRVQMRRTQLREGDKGVSRVIFYRAILGVHQILHMAHLWLDGGAIRMASDYTRHDDETVSYYCKI